MVDVVWERNGSKDEAQTSMLYDPSLRSNGLSPKIPWVPVAGGDGNKTPRTRPYQNARAQQPETVTEGQARAGRIHTGKLATE